MGICLGADLDQTYTSLDEGNTPALGDIFHGPDGKVYKFVQYEHGAAATDGVTGEVAYFYAPSGVSTGVTNVVTSDLSDSAELGAGVLQSSPADTEYCWIQTQGPATLSINLTAGADGDPLTPTGAADGTLDVAALATDAICAHAIDASANVIMCQFPW